MAHGEQVEGLRVLADAGSGLGHVGGRAPGEGQGSFWSLGDKRGQQLWLPPRLFPGGFGGIAWGGEFLGGNEEGAVAGLGWQIGVCS